MRDAQSAPSSISVPRAREHVNAALRFAEDSATARGLGKKETMSMVLATEEVFLYLCHTANPGQTVTLSCSDGAYYHRMDFVFAEDEINFRAFNVTHKPAHRNEDDMAEIGLLIASRQVNRFHIVREPNRVLRLILIKEKVCPASDGPADPAPAGAPCAVRTASPEEAERFARTASRFRDAGRLPPFFGNPGRLREMVASGDYGCAVSADAEGRQSGGILWHLGDTKTLECYGPYLFSETEDSETGEALLEACFNDLAKTSAAGLINRYPGRTLPRDAFDELGSYSVYGEDGGTSVRVVYYRQLREDPGAKVWADPQLEDFLVQEYRRLVLPRDVEFLNREDLAAAAGYSVLSTRFQREQNAATLRLLWPGEEMEENVARHVALLDAEKLRNVSAEVDLGLPWQAGFTAALLKNGFMPRLVLPDAGQGDVVLFRRPAKLDPLVPAFVKSFEPYIPSRPADVLKKRYLYDILYRMNNNENALGPPPAAQRVLDAFPSFDATFYPSGDCYHLRLRLAEYYGLHPEQFIVTNGANESITLLIKSFCEIGDDIVTADKTYGGYEWVARFSGIGATLTGLKDLTFDPEAMLEAKSARTKVLFICNPNNPTGTYWTREQLTDFMKRVSGDCIVVLDEAYCEFVDKPDYPDGMTLIAQYPNLVVFRTFSKMYGLAGLRIGYLAGDIDVVNIIRRTAVVYSVNALAQVAAEAALGDMDHIRRTREMVTAGKAYLHEALAPFGLEIGGVEGNFTTIKLPFSDSLAYRMLMRQGVMVRMMTPFRFPNSIRITTGGEEAMRACVNAMTGMFRELENSHGR